MLSKCANPACLVPFRYLHEGRIFNIDTGTASADRSGPPAHKVEHFWLCEQCAQTLIVVVENGVVTTRSLRVEIVEGAPQGKPRRKLDVA